VNGQDVIGTAAENKCAVVVNPFSSLYAILPPEAVHSLSEGKLEEAVEKMVLGKPPTGMALRDTSAASASADIEPEAGEKWRKGLEEALSKALKAALEDLRPVRSVGIRLERAYHVGYLHPGSSEMHYTVEYIADPPPKDAKFPREDQYRKSVQMHTPGNPEISRDELWQMQIAQAMNSLVEAQETPPAGMDLAVSTTSGFSPYTKVFFTRS